MDIKTEKEKVYEVVRPYDEAVIVAHAAKAGGRRLLKEVEVITDDDYKFCYLVKRPTKDFLTAVREKKAGTEPDVSGIEKLMMGLVLEGDMQELDRDASIYSELLTKVGSLVKSASSDIKKI